MPIMFEKLETILNALNHSLIAIITCYLTWYCCYSGFAEPTAFHAFFGGIGYQLLMAEGILAMYSKNALTLFASRSERTRIHWILQALGGGFALIGVIIQIVSRAQLGSAHFSSTHSTFGLISTIFLLLSSISGMTALFSIELMEHVRPVLSKFLHDLLGVLTFVCGLTTLIIAYKTKSFLQLNDPGEMSAIMIALISIVIILTLIASLRTLWNHARTIALGRYLYQVF